MAVKIIGLIIGILVLIAGIYYLVNVTDDEPPFRQTQIFNK